MNNLILNKTAAYLAVWISLLYDTETKRLIRRSNLLTTQFYCHDELREEYFGKAIILKCPKSVNSSSSFVKLDACPDVLEIYDSGSDKIVALSFPYPDLLSSVIRGKLSELRSNPTYIEHQYHRDISHIHKIVERDEKAVNRFQKSLLRETGTFLSTEEIKSSNLELLLPFTFKEESLFNMDTSKYLYTLFEER
jgi:hypothetical protein